jgi:hypothetical protein
MNIIDSQRPKSLSSFKDYEQKKNFINKIQNIDEFNKQLKMGDGVFKLLYKGLTKQ